MKKPLRLLFPVAVLVTAADPSLLQGQTNIAPEVSILWPTTNCSASYNYIFEPGMYVKIKVHASDIDGSIAQVQFFAGTNLIAIATNAPFCAIWTAGSAGSSAVLRAVAMDNLGATTESVPVWVVVGADLLGLRYLRSSLLLLEGVLQFRGRLSLARSY